MERLRQAYARNGRAAVGITYRAVPLPNGRVDLVFTVNEGEKIGIEEIVFVGNNAFSAFRLKRQLATVESGWLSFLRTTDTYDPDRLSADEDRLRRFYNNRGYPDFRVISIVPQLNAAQDAYIVTITVDEGQFHNFGAATVQSTIPEVNADELRDNIRTSAGSTFDAEDVDKTVEDMTDDLARSGHPFAQVRPRGERDAEGNIGVDLCRRGGRPRLHRAHQRPRQHAHPGLRHPPRVRYRRGDPYNKAMIGDARASAAFTMSLGSIQSARGSRRSWLMRVASSRFSISELRRSAASCTALASSVNCALPAARAAWVSTVADPTTVASGVLSSCETNRSTLRASAPPRRESWLAATDQQAGL